MKNIKHVATINAKKDSLLAKLLKDQRGFAALTGTKVIDTEFAGDWKVLVKTVTPEAASDTLTLVQATDKVTEIAAVIAVIESGLDANFTIVQASFSGLVITLKGLKADGATPADDWTGASVRLIIVAR